MNREIPAIEPVAGLRLAADPGIMPRRDAVPGHNVPAPPQPPIDKTALEARIEEINEELVGLHKRIEYSFHDRPDACIVTVIDTRTGEVIRQIPSEKLLDMASAIWERFGLWVDEER
ncbi:MAG: flagellar protein FlaG [Christensenellales bacterium]